MTKNGALFVRESIAALLNVPFFNCSHISSAMLFSIAAPTKNIYGEKPFLEKAFCMRMSDVLAVFQCSSAPAGSMPPLSSPSAI